MANRARPEPSILSVATTVGSAEDADRLARAIIAARLAACVQIDPILASHYRWEGAHCAEPEWRLTLKSLPEMLPAIQSFLAEHHPYQLPQLLWQTMGSSEAYAGWVRAQLEPAPPA